MTPLKGAPGVHQQSVTGLQALAEGGSAKMALNALCMGSICFFMMWKCSTEVNN